MAQPEVVLIVDDDPDCRELARLALRRAGFRVATSCGGKEALETLRGLRPEVVVLDIQMPHVSGFDVWSWLHASPSHHEVGVIFWTASGLRDREVHGARVVAKGASMAELVSVVREELADRSARPAQPPRPVRA